MAIGFNIVIITFTIEPFQHLAIALSTSCTMVLNFIFLIVVLHRQLGGFSLKILLTGIAKITLATLGLALLILISLPFFENALGGNKFYQLLSVFFIISSAAILYGLLLYLLRLQESTIFIDKFRQKFAGK